MASSVYQVFVTFSGEGKDGIDTVQAIDVDSSDWSGTKSTVAVTASMLSPVGLATDGDGNVYIGAAKTPAIYKWTPSGSGGSLAVVVDGSGDKSSPLTDMSGIVVLPDGSLLFGSRAQASSASAAGSKASYSIYRYDGSTTKEWVSGYGDTPEGLLLVTLSA